MSELNNLRQLEAITQAKYDEQQKGFQRILSEESRLRTELARLDDMLRQSEDPTTQIGEMRAIGADIIWKGWVSRSKTDLNLRLAQVLAIKEQQLQQVRRAFGKFQVVKQLVSDAQKAAGKKRSQAQLDLAVDIALWQDRSDQ